MEQWLIDNQVWCRLGCFIVAFSLLACFETFYAWRPWVTSRYLRIVRHLSLNIFSKILLRALFPFFAVSFAVNFQHKSMGVLHHPDWPYAVRIILAFILLDFIMYLQHRILHKYQFLWRIHRIHHMDKELDVSTSLRFHPLEEIYSMGVKIMGIAFLGALPLSVLLYEIMYNLIVMFAHVNIQFKFKNDRFLRKLIITPGMHRIHHSVYLPETNSNYGFVLSWWDKLLGTYTLVCTSGERNLALGLEEYQDKKFQTFENMLLLPFNFKQLRLKPKKKRKLKFGIEKNQ
ncbi:MAG: sterol desaturase family protein [Proteobacteria bacterium]|nr:sterol desaturase family protein [Pseudomonadota bacterium]